MRLDEHKSTYALRMRESLSEDDAGALPAEGGDGDGAFELEDINVDDLLAAAAEECDAVTRRMSDQDGELYYINLGRLRVRVGEILGKDINGEDVNDVVMSTLLPRIVPPAFRHSAEAVARNCSSDRGGIFARDVPAYDMEALTNGHQSILFLKRREMCTEAHTEWSAFIDAGGDVKVEVVDKTAAAAYLFLMFPHSCQLRSSATFSLDISDRLMKDCEMVEETMRTGTLLIRRANGLGGGVWAVEAINDARSALGLEPIYLPNSVEVVFPSSPYSLSSITKVHGLQKRIHSIELPDSVRELDDKVFAGLRLRKVFIPRSVVGAGFLRSIDDWENLPVIVAFECDERCLTAERVKAAIDKGALSDLDVRFGVTREQFRSIGMNESITNDGAEEVAGLELDVGEPAKPYNPYLHDGNDRGDPMNLATNEGDAEELINAHRNERVWTLTYSDGYYEDGELDGHDYGGRRVMTYDDALAAWQAYPLDAELRAAVGEGGYEDEHYELHILLNYVVGLDRCESEDDMEWDWDSLIPVADRYVLYDSDED